MKAAAVRLSVIARLGVCTGLCGAIVACSYVTVLVQPNARTVERGGSAEFVVSVSRVGDIANVDLSTPSQANTTATFVPAQLAPAQNTAKLTVTTATTAAMGPRTFEIQTVPPARSSRLDGRPTTATVVVGPCGARWVRQFGTNEDDGVAVALDSTPDAYVSVLLNRTALVAQVDANGETGWNLPSPLRNASGRDVGGVVQPDGSIFFVGTVRVANQYYVRVTKYSAGRALQWSRDIGPARNIGLPVDLQVSDLAVDATGVTLVGTTTGDFGGVAGDPQHLNNDGWIAKLDPNGAVLWRGQTSTRPSESFLEVVTDSAGAIFVRGRRDGVAFVRRYGTGFAEVWNNDTVFDSPIDAGGLAVSTTTDIYAAVAGISGTHFAHLIKLDANGQPQWTRQLWNVDIDMQLPSTVKAMDSVGEVLVLGTHVTGPTTASGVRLVRVDAAAGDVVGTRAIDMPQTIIAYSMAVNGTSDLYLAGVTAGDLAATNAGMLDAWVARLDYARCWR